MQPLNEIIDHVKANSPDPDACLLSFSGGKDAWSCWLALRDHFDVQPYAYYLVPGLEVVDEYLDYCERVIGKKIYRYPSPWLYERLNNYIYQPPERVVPLGAASLPEFNFDVVSRVCEIDADLPENCWTAIGVRAADSIARSGAIKTHGAWNDRRRIFYPVWDWKKADLLTALTREGIKLSKEYLTWGRSFDGLFMLYAIGLKNDYPRDYQRVLEFFPFVELEVFRFEKALEKYGSLAALPKKPPEDSAKPNQKPAAASQGSFSFNFDFKFGDQKAEEAPEKPKKEKYSKLNAETKKAAAKMQVMADPEFWISIYFPDSSRVQVAFEDGRQRDHLLTDLGLIRHGDKYLDGRFIAEKIGVKGLPGYQQFDFSLDRPENPLAELEYTDRPEKDCYAELEAVKDAMPKATLLPESQAEKFIKAANWQDITSAAGHIWCHDLAVKLDIELPQTIYFYRPYAKPDAKLNALVG